LIDTALQERMSQNPTFPLIGGFVEIQKVFPPKYQNL
jgi:hypothetical protein